MGLLARIAEREPKRAEDIFLVPNGNGGFSVYDLHGKKNKTHILKNLRKIEKTKAIKQDIDRRIRSGTFYKRPK